MYIPYKMRVIFGKINIGDSDEMLYNMTHIHYYWWIKYWRFSNKIANHQSLLLANISPYTVYTIPQFLTLDKKFKDNIFILENWSPQNFLTIGKPLTYVLSWILTCIQQTSSGLNLILLVSY